MVGSTLSIMDVEVFDMVFTKTLFQVSNAGSMLLLNQTKIFDVYSDGPWKAVAVDDSANGKLEQVEFSKNGKFQVRQNCGSIRFVLRDIWLTLCRSSPESCRRTKLCYD